MPTLRSHSFPPRDASSRGGAHRRRVSGTRWWVVGFVTMVLITGTGLATAELTKGPETLPVADKSAPVEFDDSATTPTEAPETTSSSESPSPSDESTTSSEEEPSQRDTTEQEPQDEFADLRAEVVRIVNDERASAGCGKVTVNDKLVAAATGHSEDMAENNYFDHTSRDGRDFSDRAAEQGYHRAIGENIAYGQTSAAAVMDSWMNSDGHRANILNCDARAIGLGVGEADDGTLYWTQVFGSRLHLRACPNCPRWRRSGADSTPGSPAAASAMSPCGTRERSGGTMPGPSTSPTG